MTGPGSGGGIVAVPPNALEGARTGIVQPLSKAHSLSQMGQEPPRHLTGGAADMPPKAATVICNRAGVPPTS
jgi:hypothetical protein